MTVAQNLLSVPQFQSLETRTLFAAGAMDTSFGSQGMAVVDFGEGYIAQAAATAVQSDGKTIVVGKVVKGTGSNEKYHFAIARFTIDGKLDNSFGPNKNGRMIHAVGGYSRAGATAVAVQPDGKILVAGGAHTIVSYGFDRFRFAIMRFLPNGSFDNSFGKSGFTDVGFDGSATPHDIALQNDGKIVIAGDDYNFTKPYTNFAICRLNVNGSRDNSFDTDGRRSVDLGSNSSDSGSSVAIDYTGTAATNPNYGKIVMAGTRWTATGSGRAALIRFKTNGFIDNSFDKDGKVFTSIPGNLAMSASDLLFQPDGKIVIAGGGNGNFAMQRFLPTGAADNSFGTDGNSFVITSFGANSAADKIHRNGDGSLIVAGRVNEQFALAKYSANGVPDYSFGDGGKVRSAFGSETDWDGVGFAYGPGKRFVVAGGLGFGTARYMDTGANVVTIGTFNTNASEAGPKGTGFVVGRPERLPTPLRVYLNVSGTARAPGRVSPIKDYTGTGMSFGNGQTTSTYVDIPANQTFASVGIMPIDDLLVEGTETAIFSIAPNPAYEPDIHSKVTINIADNDGTLLNATADSYVRDGTNAATNYGAAADLSVKRASSGFNRQVYMKFHIDAVSTITTAKLRLFGKLSALEGAGIATSVFGAPSTSWSESGLTWNNRPALSGSALSTTTITDTTARWYEWDVSAYVQAQKAAGKTVVTLVLTNLINSSQFSTFNSREAGNGPQLLVG